MSFAFFDPTQDVYIHYRKLPHWEQAGGTYFITWRTLDSIPQATIRRWLVERAMWLRRHRIDPQAADWRGQLRMLPRAARQEYHEHFTQRWMDCLDECHGACVLRQPELSELVADSLLHFDNDEYVVAEFVVMPNHVHVLVQFPSEGQCKRRCRGWKHFTATEINLHLGTSGRFWQVESFDHLVRSEEQFEYLQRYIGENGPRAGLASWEYRHYRRK